MAGRARKAGTMRRSILSAWLAIWILGAIPLSAADDLFEHSYAVVIGIDHYPRFRQLQYAVKDAEAIAAYLRTQNYDQVITLYDQAATKQAILATMQNQLAPRLKKNDRVLIFFAGHGYTETLGGKDRGYIVPYDGGTQSSEYISMDELRTLADYMGNARHMLFIMDSCYGGLLGAETRGIGVDPGAPGYVNDMAHRITRQVLTAGGKDQQVLDGGSKGHSVFVDAFLEALADGKADRNRNGYITFSELTDYLMARASNPYQTPSASVLPGNQGGEYLFRSPLAPSTAATATGGPAEGAPRSAQPLPSPSARAESSGPEPVAAADLKTTPSPSREIEKIFVAVLDNNGYSIPNISPASLRVFENGAPETVLNVSGAGPATIAVLIQFDNQLRGEASGLVSVVSSFIQTLPSADWISVSAYSMQPSILTDFSQDHALLSGALSHLPQLPAFSEANLFDALSDFEGRMKALQGRKAIVVFTDGVDTFSKSTLVQTLATITHDGVPIYAVRLDTPRSQSSVNETIQVLDALTAAAGGKSFYAESAGKFPAVFDAIGGALGAYQVSLQRSGQKTDNPNIEVQLVDPQTGAPLRLVDAKGAEIPYHVVVLGTSN
jgi:uncharacterized caspase-like protein